MYIKKLRSDQIERMVDFRKSRQYRAALRAIVLREFKKEKAKLITETIFDSVGGKAVSYTHLTLPTKA